MNAPIKGTASKAENGLPYGSGEGGDEGLLDLDLRALYRTLRKRLGVIVGITIGVTALAMVWVFQQTPIYVAEVQILLDRQKMQVTDMQAVMSGLSPDGATIDSEMQILRSRTLAARVVEQLKLTQDPEFNGALREPSMLRWLDPRVWIGSVLSVLEAEQPPQNEEADAQAELNRAINGLLGRMTVARQRGSYVIAVGFLSENPAKASRIANAIAETYILDQLDAKFDGTRQANEWLSRRLAELRQQVRDSERAVEIYRAEQGLETPSGVTLNEQELSELNAQLILARASLAEVQARYSRARQIRASGGSIESVTDVIQSGTITGLRQKQAELARELANLSSKYGPRHPEIVNAEAQRRDIQRQIGAEIERIMGSLQNNVAVAESRVSALEETCARCGARLAQAARL